MLTSSVPIIIRTFFHMIVSLLTSGNIPSYQVWWFLAEPKPQLRGTGALLCQGSLTSPSPRAGESGDRDLLPVLSALRV